MRKGASLAPTRVKISQLVNKMFSQQASQQVLTISFLSGYTRLFSTTYYSRFQVTFQSAVNKFVLNVIPLPKYEDCVGTGKANFTTCLLRYQSTELKSRSAEYRFYICTVLKDNKQIWRIICKRLGNAFDSLALFVKHSKLRVCSSVPQYFSSVLRYFTQQLANLPEQVPTQYCQFAWYYNQKWSKQTWEPGFEKWTEIDNNSLLKCTVVTH